MQHDRNGEAEVALPDVDRPEPVVEVAQVGMRAMMDFMIRTTRPMGRAMPTSDGDTRPMARRPSVADEAAGGGMPTAYKWGPVGRSDRTWPRAKPMMSRRTPGCLAVTDSDLPGTPEGSSALPRMWR